MRPYAPPPPPRSMEALRAAGRAVLRSPGLARHRLGVSRLRQQQRPRQQPAEEGGPDHSEALREPLLLREPPRRRRRHPPAMPMPAMPTPTPPEGRRGGSRCFALKYLGMTLVETPRGEAMAAAAIRRITATARVGSRKFPKVILTVSPRGLSLQDADSRESLASVSIYRISYCATDKLQNKVFAYVAQNPQDGALECHAFLSPKKKVAQAVTLTVAQAFQMALDLWEAAAAAASQAGSGDKEEEAKVSVHLQSPLCPTDSSACPLPMPSPVGSLSFHTDLEEEEDEEGEEEEPGLQEAALAGFTEEGGHHDAGVGELAFGSVGGWGCSPPSSCFPPGGLF